ncbi:MAG: sigma-54 dependent transcriptional regulator [Pseudomonadota bacterium]
MNDDNTKFSLLLVDDEPPVLASLKRLFHKENYDIHSALSGETALSVIRDTHVDAALVDLKMPGMDGLTLLKKIKQADPGAVVIILTGHGGVQEAVAAMKEGAADFLEKPFTPEALSARMAQVHQIWQLQRENRRLRDLMQFQFGFDQLLGNSTGMLQLKQTITRIGPSDTPVLIQGETGTGKELVARAVHHHSPRSKEIFMPVDCAAISETVIESELFGHVKGAFTGAYTSVLGLIRSADKGTLFLDEIGELSPAMQSKLLRSIQESEVKPVGSNMTYPVDIRVLAATNRDLAQEVARGNFREDLLYRLNVVTLQVPPLRDRKEDISLVARYFVKRFKNKASPVTDISTQAMAFFEHYRWPGNVRELENVIRRAVALGSRETILPEDLPAVFHSSPPEPHPGAPVLGDGTLAAYEKAAIQQALVKCGNNRKKTAEMLCTGEATLYRKIKKYRLDE